MAKTALAVFVDFLLKCFIIIFNMVVFYLPVNLIYTYAIRYSVVPYSFLFIVYNPSREKIPQCQAC